MALTTPLYLYSGVSLTSSTPTPSSKIVPLLANESWTSTPGIGATLNVYFGKNASAEEQAAVQSILTNISTYTNLNFVYQADAAYAGEAGADVTFTFNGTPAASALTEENIYFDDGSTAVGLFPGQPGYEDLIAEILLGLGMKHPTYQEPGDYAPYLSDYNAVRDNTVLALSTGYLPFENSLATPAYLDIQALQYLYGTNASGNSGDTTYVLSDNGENGVIGDTGGYDTVTIDRYFTGDVTIQLNKHDEGYGNESHIGNTFVWFVANTIERVYLRDGQNEVRDNNLDNYIKGGSNYDRIFTIEGSDTLVGGDGNDLLMEGGNNTSDSNLLRGGKGNDRLGAGSGKDTLYGDEGNDILETRYSKATVLGGEGDDYFGLYGNSGTKAYGNIGNDTIEAQGSQDTAYGGEGEDVFTLQGGKGFFLGDSGDDHFTVTNGAFLLHGGADDDYFHLTSSVSTVRGGAGNDTIEAFYSAPNLLGESGNDTITILHHAGRADGGTGHDTLNGSQYADTLIGGEGDDSISGSSGKDTILGDAGNDTLNGGTSGDTLTGGGDNDTFLYTTLADSIHGNADRIKDFTQGEDVIHLAGLGFTDIQAEAASGTVLGYATTATRTIISSGDFEIQLDGVIALTDADFIFG